MRNATSTYPVSITHCGRPLNTTSALCWLAQRRKVNLADLRVRVLFRFSDDRLAIDDARADPGLGREGQIDPLDSVDRRSRFRIEDVEVRCRRQGGGREDPEFHSRCVADVDRPRL